MSAGRVMPSGSSRLPRLDPFTLPVQFHARDVAADEQVRIVELHRKRVVMRRSIAGMRMAMSLPVSNYLGVALQIVAPDDTSDGAVAVVLAHADAALAVPLFTAATGVDALTQWRAWGHVLGLPLLVADADGSLREPMRSPDAVRIARPQARRRRGSPLKRRRPRILARRRASRLPKAPRIHREEREIIARS